MMDFNKVNNVDLVVTRHKGLIEYLKNNNVINNNTEIISHATANKVKDKNVLGVLPHSLSCLTKSFSEISLNIPPDLRGIELTSKDIELYANEIVTYMVEKAQIILYDNMNLIEDWNNNTTTQKLCILLVLLGALVFTMIPLILAFI